MANNTLHKAAYDGICAETIQTRMRFDRKRKWVVRVSPEWYELLDEKLANHVSNNADFSIAGIIEMQNLIL